MVLSNLPTYRPLLDIGSSSGNSMYTFLEMRPYRNAFLMSNRRTRWSPAPCFPRLAHVDSRNLAAANGGVGANRSSRLSPRANS
eukprot:1114911-Lingulodinium_polyedra.AAC.1